MALLAGSWATWVPPMLWPVLPLIVIAVISCVVVNVITMPSAGVAGIVIVPVASVPAGLMISVVVPEAKVYEKPVVRAWKSYDCKTPLFPSIFVGMVFTRTKC